MSTATRIAPRPRLIGRPSAFSIVAAMTVLLCLVLFVWPVVMIVLGAFRSGSPGLAQGWTTDAIRDVTTSPEARTAVKTSTALAVLVTIISKSLSFYFAWLVARTNTPLRRLITPVMLVVLATPPLFFVISWGLLGQERIGLGNKGIELFTGEPSTFFNVNSFFGIVFVSALKSVAFGYFLLLGPLRAMSGRLEEAAAISGASKFRTFWTVSVPMMAPAFGAAVILGFIVALEYFEGPLILGSPAGIEVISTQIYAYLNDESPPQFAQASALAIVMLIALLLLLGVQRLVQGRRSYETVGGKAGIARPWDLGRWKYVGTLVFVVYAALALIAPGVQLVLASLQPYLGATSDYTLDNYRTLLEDPLTAQALKNTAALSIFAGLAVMLFALAMAFVIRHGNRRITGLISSATWLPFAMPGPALALGILWILLSYSFTQTFYGSFGAMLVALAIVAVPVAMRNLEPAAAQVSRDLEEAAWIAGAHRARGYLAIVARLILPSFLAGWLLSAIIIGGNLVMPLMIGSPLMQTVPQRTYDLYTANAGPMAAALSIVFLLGIVVVFLTGLALKATIERVLARRHPGAEGTGDRTAQPIITVEPRSSRA